MADLDLSDAARLARAAEQGFDTSQIWYHGTHQDGLDALVDGWFSEDPEVTREFGPVQYAVYLKLKRPATDDTLAAAGGEKTELHRLYEEFVGEELDRDEIEADCALRDMAAADGPFTRFLKKRGFDGIIVWDDSNRIEAYAAVPFSASQIRSVDAAFDPAFADETCLVEPWLKEATAPGGMRP